MIEKIKEIYIEQQEDFSFWVIFEDENGISILAKTKNEDVARRKEDKFKSQLNKGFLLKPEKSAYK